MSEPSPEKLTSAGVLGMLTGSPSGEPARFRISRPCYDKFRRCPGWAGGGTRYARVRRCDNGFLKYYDEEGLLQFWWARFYRCPKCRVVVLPYMTRYLDWRYLWYLELKRIPGRIENWKYWRNYLWENEETGERWPMKLREIAWLKLRALLKRHTRQ